MLTVDICDASRRKNIKKRKGGINVPQEDYRGIRDKQYFILLKF